MVKGKINIGDYVEHDNGRIYKVIDKIYRGHHHMIYLLREDTTNDEATATKYRIVRKLKGWEDER